MTSTQLRIAATDERRPTILMIGPLPPPIGGQSVLVSNLLAGAIADRFRYLVLDVAHESSGLARIVRSARFLTRLCALLLLHPSIAVVHIHTSAGRALFEKSAFVAVAKVFRKRILLHVHGGRFRAVWQNASRAKQRLIRRLLDQCDAIAVLGPGWTSFYREEVGCSCRIAVLPHAVRAPTVRVERDARSVTLLYAGQLRREKGLIDLAHAMRLAGEGCTRELRLRIMGTGDTAESETAVRRAFVDMPVRVDFLGALSGESKWREFARADVFVLPSHSEDMPLSILEAMAVGLPVITTRVGSISEAIDHGVEGLLVDPHDETALAQAISELAIDEARRISMGAAARRKSAQHFSFERYEAELETLYRSLLE